jgi:hypothetical protein
MHRHEMQQTQLFIYFKNFLEFCFHVKIRVLQASGLIEGHEQPLPSIGQDMIDNMAQPTACSLILLVGGSFRMEAGRGRVYPC